ncbi:MAG: TolC family protein [Bryobacteraceae bacterium]
METIRARTLWPNPIAVYSRETAGLAEFVTGEQQLPLSGRLGLERKAMEPARESAEAEGSARLWAVRSSLRLAFYRTLAAQEQARILRSSLAEMQTVLNLIRVREREGEGSRYDRMRVERETAEMRADLALVEARAHSERATVFSYLPPRTETATIRGDVNIRIVTPSREDVRGRTLTTRAEIRAESSRLEHIAFEQQAADRLKIPEPAITAGLKRAQIISGQNANGAVVAVSISLPLFNRGKTEVARLSAERERTQARRDFVTQRVLAEVDGAYDLYGLRLAALQAFDEEMRNAAELLRVVRIGYEEGELGILQLLDAFRLERQRALRRLELQSAVKDAEIELSRTAGFEVAP